MTAPPQTTPAIPSAWCNGYSAQSPLVRDTAAKVAAYYHVEPARLFGRERAESVTRPRWVLMYALRQCGLTVCGIGRCVGRDHATVIHGIRKVSDRLRIDGDFAREVGYLMERIGDAPPAR